MVEKYLTGWTAQGWLEPGIAMSLARWGYRRDIRQQRLGMWVGLMEVLENNTTSTVTNMLALATICLRRTSLLFLVILPDLPNKVMESFVDIDPLLRRRLNELASKVLREITTLIYANLSLIFQVTLVCDDYNGKGIFVLDAENLLVECVDFLDRVTRGD